MLIDITQKYTHRAWRFKPAETFGPLDDNGGIGVIELEAFPSEWVSSRFLSLSSQNTLRG